MSQSTLLSKYSFSPEDFMLYGIDHFRAGVRHVSGSKLEDPKTDQIVFRCAKTAFHDLSVKNLFTSTDLDDKHILTVLILQAARLADGLRNVEPNMSLLRELTGINRNRIAICSEVLEDMGLVEIKHVKREKNVFPTELALLYLDLVLLNGRQSSMRLKEIAREFADRKSRESVIQSLQQFETAFDFAERKYPSNTLNFQILDRLHRQIMEALVDAQNGKDGRHVLAEIVEIIRILDHMSETREKAKELGLSPVVVEQTDEELGGRPVYQVKS
jgi:hypothetical protein